MTNLRQAAEMALEALQDTCDHLPARSGVEREVDDAITALRQALAHEALDRMVAENQRLGLYDDLQTAIERGTKAWADVPDATEWVEELRGNDTPEVTGEVTTEVLCKTHPDAPHGFDRNASHSADRYVCECEGWEPVDNAYTKNDTKAGVLHKEWVGLSEDEFEKILETHNEAMPFAIYSNIEAALKEKNA